MSERAERLALLQRVVLSKQWFDKVKHKMVLEVMEDTASTVLSQAMHFPRTLAAYNEVRQLPTHGVDEFLAEAASHPPLLVLQRDHLPSWEEVCRVADEHLLLLRESSSTDEAEADAWNPYCRPLLESGAAAAGAAAASSSSLPSFPLLCEAELRIPVVFSDRTRLRIVVKKGDDDDPVCHTAWATGKDLVTEASATMAQRKAVVSTLRESEVVRTRMKAAMVGDPRLLSPLAAGVGMAFRHDDDDSTTTDASLSFSSPPFATPRGTARLTHFALVWTRRGGKRRLALASATVAFVYEEKRGEEKKAKKPKKQQHSSVSAEEEEECAACLEAMLSTSSPETLWQCTQCRQTLHAACFGVWAAQCRRTGSEPSCPLCRA